MLPLAAERTAEVFAAGVARVGEEEDAAVRAMRQRLPLASGPAPRCAPQQVVVLEDERRDLALAIPARRELEKPLDLRGKRARDSDRMLGILFTPLACMFTRRKSDKCLWGKHLVQDVLVDGPAIRHRRVGLNTGRNPTKTDRTVGRNRPSRKAERLSPRVYPKEPPRTTR